MSHALRLSFFAGFAMSVPALAVPFTANNLVLSQVGTGTTLNGQAAQVTIREFGLSGALTGALAGNDLAYNSGAQAQRLVVGGSTSSEGFISLTSNGQYLLSAGYNWAVGTVSPNGTSIGASFNNGSASDVRRTVARVDGSGNVNYYDMTVSYSQSNYRSAASVDGSVFITGGAAGTAAAHAGTGGVRLFDPAGGNTSTVGLAPTPQNVRVVNLDLAGNIFFSSGSGAFTGVSQIVAGGVAQQLPGMSTSGLTLSTYDFWFRDENTLYAADDGSISAGSNGGLQKWTRDTGTGQWSLAYILKTGLTAGLRGLTGTIDGNGDALLYATSADTASKLVGIVDTGAASSFTTLATAPTNTFWRDVAFTPGTTPVPAPGVASVLGLAGLVAARRRR